MARIYLQKGAHVVLLDKNKTLLENVRSETEKKMPNVHLEGYALDITDLGASQQIIDTIARKQPIDVFINNAGLVGGRSLLDLDHKAIDKVIDLNVKALMHLSKIVLAEMQKAGRGHIVNIASAAGFTPVPGMAPYVGSKWAVVGFSESLRLEMETLGKGFRCTTVCPSYIDTGMFKGAKDNFLIPMLRPEKAALAIVKGIGRGKRYVRIPFMVRFTPFLRGVLPTRVYDLLIGKWLGIYRSMAHFEGKSN
jgi:short-subunit dehydrogenase